MDDGRWTMDDAPVSSIVRPVYRWRRFVICVSNAAIEELLDQADARFKGPQPGRHRIFVARLNVNMMAQQAFARVFEQPVQRCRDRLGRRRIRPIPVADDLSILDRPAPAILRMWP